MTQNLPIPLTVSDNKEGMWHASISRHMPAETYRDAVTILFREIAKTGFGVATQPLSQPSEEAGMHPVAFSPFDMLVKEAETRDAAINMAHRLLRDLSPHLSQHQRMELASSLSSPD